MKFVKYLDSGDIEIEASGYIVRIRYKLFKNQATCDFWSICVRASTEVLTAMHTLQHRNQYIITWPLSLKA